jgi:ABC-type multidrug transport system fused ATPase/permease subunit
MLESYQSNYVSRRNWWCSFFILFAFAIGIFAFIQKLIFTHLGENLTFTLRLKLFEGVIYKQVSWFDNKHRAPGVLTNTLSEDITEINGMTTETISVYLEAFFGIAIGFIIAVCYTWNMALIALGASPFVIFGALGMSRA